jgi:hypothetical protein
MVRLHAGRSLDVPVLYKQSGLRHQSDALARRMTDFGNRTTIRTGSASGDHGIDATVSDTPLQRIPN